MATPRTLGKARVLGTPRTLSPAIPDHLRNTALPSPSASSLSLNSQVSTSKSSNEDNDIAAAVAQQAKDESAVVPAPARLVCPICEEDMVTLLQLNRHLDDTHKHLESVEQDEVKTWFKTQVVKAKKFQPLSVLNQKLKQLDIFDSDDEQRPNSPAPAPQSTPTSAATSVPGPAPRPVNPDESVTRTHWQRHTANGACSDPMCGRRLGSTNGSINCRKCGKLFCDEHTMYQMRLSRLAQHDPAGGYWCRVCETCYISREGYIEYTGADRDHTTSFVAMRRKAVDKSYMEVSRLEKRLTKLTQLLMSPTMIPEQTTVGYLWSLASKKTPQRAAEQSIVEWEDDLKVLSCPFCQQEFSTYGFRRHHCRLCGRVVCADPQTGCSSKIMLDVNKAQDTMHGAAQANTVLGVRMCKDCIHTLFSRADFAKELALVPPDERTFRNLKQFETGIQALLPRFQKLLSALQDADRIPSASQLADATKVRKRLTDAFTQYATAAKRIRDLPTTSPQSTQARLQASVYANASRFLHTHMLPLKSLPKLLKHAEPISLPLVPGSEAALSKNMATAASAHNTRDPPITELEADESSLRSRLVVLQEQQFLVREMLADARKRRRFEEADALARNVEELEGETAAVEASLRVVNQGFERAYSNKPG